MSNQTAAPVPQHATPSLYVGDLAPNVTEAILYENFSAVGPVASVRVCRDAVTRRSLGYGYVNFHRLEDAERSLNTMNYTEIMGRACRIMWSHRDPSMRRSGAGNIFIKNLDTKIDSKQLFDTFSIFGNILSCKVSTKLEDGSSLGYGFVHYESEDDAKKAISKVNNKIILEKKVTVEMYKSKQERQKKKASQYTNLFVKNLPADYTIEKLNTLFGVHGEIASCVVKKSVVKKKAPKAAPAPVEGEEAAAPAVVEAPKAEELSSCFGFVDFKEHASALKAVEAFANDFKVEDREIYVAPAIKKKAREEQLKSKFEAMKAERAKQFAGVNLYIRNFNEAMDEEKLRVIFSDYGNITSTKVMRDEATGKSKGFGFVSFSTPDEATKAVTKANNRMVDGKPLYVAMAQPRSERKEQLDAFHANQRKVLPPQSMYGQPRGMYGQPGGPHMIYAQQVGQWQGHPNPNMMMRGPVNYQLMPMQNGRPQQRGPNGPRGPRQQQQRGPQGQQGQGQRRAPQQAQQRAPQQPQQPVVAVLDVKKLAQTKTAEEKTQMIGEVLYPRVSALVTPDQAGKITGMLLEMEDNEILMLLDNDEALNAKVKEAIEVLEHHTV